MKGEKYHEIMFIHKAEFKDERDKSIIETIKNIEGEDNLRYEWIDLKDINKYPIKPEFIKGILKENKYPVHRINDDRK